METDKHYFLVGLFIIGLSIAAAFFALWLEGSGHRDDVRYRIHFPDSVSGLAEGDPVKYRGVDVGNVEKIMIDPDDIRLVRVDVKLRKTAPIKTDTLASLRLKGITGVLFIELTGGSPDMQNLVDATPKGQVPEIKAQPSSLNAVLDQLPKTVEKFNKIEDQIVKLLSDKNISMASDAIGQVDQTAHHANELSQSLKEDPSQLLGFHHKKPKDDPAAADSAQHNTFGR